MQHYKSGKAAASKPLANTAGMTAGRSKTSRDDPGILILTGSCVCFEPQRLCLLSIRHGQCVVSAHVSGLWASLSAVGVERVADLPGGFGK